MRDGSNGGNGQNGGSGRRDGGFGGGRSRGGNGNPGTARDATPRPSGGGGAAPGQRWSDELDAIFERAPKDVTAPKNDDERNFFEERTEVKSHNLLCPNCRQSADYALTWLVRRKREHPAGYADDAVRARFEKARSYMVRREDNVTCQSPRCGKRFEVVGVQTVAFLENAAKGSVEDRAARVRAAFAGRARD